MKKQSDKSTSREELLPHTIVSELEDGSFVTDPLDEPTVGHTILEKLALAIIDAHPTNAKYYGNQRQKRMRDAIVALTGRHHSHGSKEVDDRHALHWMAIQLSSSKIGSRLPASSIFGEEDPTYKFENVTSLAREAVRRFGLASHAGGVKAATERLYKKLKGDETLRKEVLERREQLWELGKDETPPKTEKEWCDEVRFASVAPHLIEHQMLKDMAEKLRRCGIKCAVPAKVKAFY